jgi:Ran GTPase-activating protein (RanGAP) involved in mRNA processing and transport
LDEHAHSRCNEINDDAWWLLAQSKHLKKLKRLHLEDNDLTATGFARVVGKNAPLMAQLEELHLLGNHFADLGQQPLTHAVCPALRHLDLSNCNLNAEGMAVLVRSGLLAAVESLTLNYNPLGKQSLDVLTQTTHLQNLAELRLLNCELGSNDAKALAQAHLPKLRYLEIGYNRLTSLGVMALTKATWFHQLFWLNLNGIAFSAKAAEAISNAGPMPHLYYLGCNGIRDAALQRILRKRLRKVVIF